MTTRPDISTMDDEALLLPGEVAVLFGVNPKTVSKWALTGKFPCVLTVGGHRRYRVGDVRPYIEGVDVSTTEL